MKTFILLPTDFDPHLDPKIVAKIEAICRNVRITEGGYLYRAKTPDDWAGRDWRFFYEKLLQRMFPAGWIYCGGHHLAAHASPPPNPRVSRMDDPVAGQAGRCLFRIIEAKKLFKLKCGLHWGETKTTQCWKCTSGWRDREIASARNANLLAAVAENVL